MLNPVIFVIFQRSTKLLSIKPSLNCKMTTHGIPQKVVDYQLSHHDDFNCEGMQAFTIAGMIIVTMAVVLRL